MILTKKIPFIQSWAKAPLWASIAAFIAVGVHYPFTGFAHAHKVELLFSSQFPWLMSILLANCMLTQLVNNRFIKRFHHWPSCSSLLYQSIDIIKL
jgi:P-type Mg2+ transporter